MNNLDQMRLIRYAYLTDFVRSSSQDELVEHLIKMDEIHKNYRNKIKSVNDYIDNSLNECKEGVKYYENLLQNTDKNSTYYEIYLKMIHKLNAKRQELDIIKKLLNS